MCTLPTNPLANSYKMEHPGNSRGSLDIVYILFPFVFSAALIIMIVVCWWKCKLRSWEERDAKESGDWDDPAFGHLINIQEYAENQIGTTIVYAESPGSHCPNPYVYFSDGHITRIVPLTPSQTLHALTHEHSCPSALLCSNMSSQAAANRSVSSSALPGDLGENPGESCGSGHGNRLMQNGSCIAISMPTAQQLPKSATDLSSRQGEGDLSPQAGENQSNTTSVSITNNNNNINNNNETN